MSTIQTAFIGLALTAATGAFALELPRSEKELPVFPVAFRDKGMEASLRAAEPMGPRNSVAAEKSSSAHLAFTTGHPAEEVLIFYQHVFGVPIPGDDPVPPIERLSFHGLETMEDCYSNEGQKIFDAHLVRDYMEKTRRPFRPGKWLESASFFWVVEEADGDFSELELKIQDFSFACRKGETSRRGTEIYLSRTTWRTRAGTAVSRNKR